MDSTAAGTFWINGHRAIHACSPLGGYKHSGHGRTSGMQALYEYTPNRGVRVQAAADAAMPLGRA